MKQNYLILLTMGILLSLSSRISSQTSTQEQTPDKLVVVWTSGDMPLS
jgi:hypothetical protein